MVYNAPSPSPLTSLSRAALSQPAACFRHDLVRSRQLVCAAWLAALVDGARVPEAPRPGWRLLEVGCDGAGDYMQAHVPGALRLDTNAIEGPPLWNKVADDTLLGVLWALGIRHDTTVILYGRNNLAAARAAHLLLYAGVTDVRLLDGGFAAWQAAGLRIETGPPPPCLPVADFGAPFPGRPDYLIGLPQARALLASADGALVSIRSEAEFLGKVSGYHYIAARGDIPGARWGRAGADGDVNSMSAYHDEAGRMKPAADIAAFWGPAGVVPGQRNAFYCGTGWRASLAFFYAWLMDWPDICVYDGGWLEWSRAVACEAA
ncbi:sulfurtransferase [Pseudoduganella flava]|nr:sulfurtransferase [Pseudoduganella flava]